MMNNYFINNSINILTEKRDYYTIHILFLIVNISDRGLFIMPLYNNLIKKLLRKEYTDEKACGSATIKYANILFLNKLFSPYISHNAFKDLFVDKRVQIMIKGDVQWQK